MVVVCLVIGGLLLSGSGGARQLIVPNQTDIQLPSGAWPRTLAFSDDGALWIAESGLDAIARLDPEGNLTQHPVPGGQPGIGLISPGDIVEGPKGGMWFAGFLTIGRIDPAGEITSWEFRSPQGANLGDPEAITVGPDGPLWYASEEVPPRINRIGTAGSITGTQLVSGGGGLYVAGIAQGPDGALWFTQSPVGDDDPPDAIGRVTTDGQYTRWPLPNSHSTPMRITAGSDGALWFTEREGNRIGRITTSGVITEFPLRPSLSPFDITSGADGALWFTTDTCLGRITTSGKVTTWAVANAKQLAGIAAAADGSFWLADGPADAVRHFTPPQFSAPPTADCS